MVAVQPQATEFFPPVKIKTRQPGAARSAVPKAVRRHHAVCRSMPVSVVVAFLIFAGALAAIGYRLTVEFLNAPKAAATLIVPVAVRPGDTLWSLARRYGDPKQAVAAHVALLARTNHLQPGASLIPGQRLSVPVANPIEIARLQQTSHHQVALANTSSVK